MHRERIRPDDDDPGGDILRDLGMILLGELFGLLVVRLDLGADRGAVAGRIRIRVASGAGGGQDTAMSVPPRKLRIANSPDATHVPYMFYTTISCSAMCRHLRLQEYVLDSDRGPGAQ